MFKPAGDSSSPERKARDAGIRRLRFGIDFLDHALRGIFPDDLVLIGSPSGVGKTQICCNIAQANLEDGKKVHYIALEASEFEIERRLKFPLVLSAYLADKDRPKLFKKINFTDWILGEFKNELALYEDQVEKYFESAYRDLFVFNKQERFTVDDLISAVHYCASDTDLILVDHVHYFDFDDDNENRAIKEIAKTVRTLALEEQKPIVLVAHLRKRDKANDEIVAGLEEFHGGSDLFKIASRVITVAPGKMTSDGLYETFFRTPKNRFDGGVTRFIAKEFFNPKTREYEKGRYQLGWAEQKRARGFEELDRSLYPDWAKGLQDRERGSGGNGGSYYPNAKRPPNLAPQSGRQSD
jgi:KaiC/GvpD/RAD55 family RecA-like ATPase